jgi:hypothetical protein
MTAVQESFSVKTHGIFTRSSFDEEKGCCCNINAYHKFDIPIKQWSQTFKSTNLSLVISSHFYDGPVDCVNCGSNIKTDTFQFDLMNRDEGIIYGVKTVVLSSLQFEKFVTNDWNLVVTHLMIYLFLRLIKKMN